MLRNISLGIAVLLLTIPLITLAQENVIVPDVAGLNVPQAAAALNRAGLRLGVQTAVGWTADSGVPQNTVGSQSVAAGSSVTYGASVDVTVYRSPNIRLIYDDNDLTMMNLSDIPLDIPGLIFNGVEGTTASMAASRWSNVLREGQCLQVWSVGRNGPKDVEGCQFIQGWFSTVNTAEHFWTQVNGVARFNVVENGVERAVCDAAVSPDNPLTCEFFIAGGGANADVTPYVYLVYTTGAIAFINNTDDRWMPTNQTTLYNYNPGISVAGSPLVFGDPGLFRNPDIVADITLLAPHQCLLLTITGSDISQPPDTCDVITQRDLDATVAFWVADFEVESGSDGRRRTCPAATPDRTTICVMPR